MTSSRDYKHRSLPAWARLILRLLPTQPMATRTTP